MNHLDELINQLEAQIKHLDKANLDVSKANVGWHIDHSFLVIAGVSTALARSNPSDHEWSFNFNRLVVFTMRKFPRGRGKAPESAVPKGEITIERLMENVVKVRRKLAEMKDLDADKFFKHPFFGDLRKQQTLKFLEIHTKHHLDIITDILK